MRTEAEREKLCEEIKALKATGLTNQLIGYQLGVSPQTVANYLHGYVGVKLSDYNLNAARKLTDAQVEEIRRRYAAGEKGWALAHEFKVDPSTITYWVNPGRPKRVNDISKQRHKERLKHDLDYRQHVNDLTNKAIKRRRKIIDQINKGEITK